MVNNLTPSKTFILSLIAGVTTGMGNGSVFAITVMSAIGRGPFDNWGGWNSQAYWFTSFHGLVDWFMIIFGLAFTAIMMIAFNRHGELEAAAGNN